MEEFIARLLDLQDKDRKIDRVKADLESIPQEIKIHRTDTEGHETRFSVFTDKLESIRAEQSKLASDRSENVVRIADYKSRLLSLKSNDEYAAMLKQISHTEKLIDQIDSRIIEAMYAEDEAMQMMGKAQKERDRAVRRSESREESLKNRISELENSLRELESARAEIAASVEPKQLKMYEKSRSTGRREAVTGLKNGACGSCLTKIPPQSAGEIKGGRTFTCPICGSFVVWTSDSSL